MQDSTASEHSAEPASSTKLASYSRHVAGLVREGSVAERVSQLQARILARPSSPSAQPNYIKSPARSVTETLSKYSTSGPLLSPASVPLPETPTRRNRVTGQSWQENSTEYRATIQDDGTNVLAGHLQNAPISRYDTGSPSSRRALNTAESSEEPVLQVTPDKQPSSTNLSARLDSRDSSMNHLVSPKSFTTPQSMKDQHQSLNNLERTPPLVPEGLRLQSTLAHLGSSPDPVKRTINSSAGSAYSKILPFTSSPSVPSYIPRRQSRVFDSAESPSSGRLKRVILLDQDAEEGTETLSTFRLSPGFQSLHRQESRSLRRRNLNTKSDDSVQRNITIETTPTATPTSTDFRGDIFVDPTNMIETYPDEKSCVPGAHSITSSSNPHDIHNVNYVPSVMPRRLDFRQAMRSRYVRPAPVLSAQTHVPKDEPHENPAIPNVTSLDQSNIVSHQIFNSISQSDSSGESNETDGSNTSGNSSRQMSGSSGHSSSSWFVLQQRFTTADNDKILEDSQNVNKVSRPKSHHHRDTVIPPLDGTNSRRIIQNGSVPARGSPDSVVMNDSALHGKDIEGSPLMDSML